MKVKFVLLAATAGLTMCAGVAVTSAQDVVISPEQDTVIREYVQKKPLASVSVPGVELNIGSTLPETVELHAFEDVPDMKYQYVVVDNKTVLVEPGTRKIVKIYN